ncbi:hypothetical protein E1264_20740 [Actinomadura sp. KC216]|uniref:hypothetical protein n=1 Tax=Actinomadura sp. KC216 TaxID=2530370 RepID=UPI0010436384|nr:hypothetical protein [Actinomadura sp. KC216]TDB85564.1 hypothetical protein E1264_20740 [Actinomadura sp. KC216]
MSRPEEHVIPESVTYLWDRVKDALKACGEPSPRDIDRLAASCGLKLPSSTVEGWFKTWSVVPAWEKLDALVKALGAEHDEDWKSLHADAQLADRRQKADTRRFKGKGRRTPAADSTPSPANPNEAGRPPPTDEHRRMHVIAELNRLPSMKATVTHIPDRKAVALLSLGALAVLVALAVFFTELGPGGSGDSGGSGRVSGVGDVGASGGLNGSGAPVTGSRPDPGPETATRTLDMSAKAERRWVITRPWGQVVGTTTRTKLRGWLRKDGSGCTQVVVWWFKGDRVRDLDVTLKRCQKTAVQRFVLRAGDRRHFEADRIVITMRLIEPAD